MEIMRSGGPSDASHLAASKYGKSDAGSIVSKEDSLKNKHASKFVNKQTLHVNNKNKAYQKSRYTKTDATRTDTKSYKQTYSRDNSLSSGRSGMLSKRKNAKSNSRSTR